MLANLQLCLSHNFKKFYRPEKAEFVIMPKILLLNDEGARPNILLERPFINRVKSACLLLAMASLFVSGLCANAQSVRNQLLMITSNSCPWCEAFEEEVGSIYDQTEEAAFMPLRRHDFFDVMPNDLEQITPATMTPTFVILRDGAEIGRIIGYPGAELFWWRLSEFVVFDTQLEIDLIK